MQDGRRLTRVVLAADGGQADERTGVPGHRRTGVPGHRRTGYRLPAIG
jgi:hypothetical protein